MEQLIKDGSQGDVLTLILSPRTLYSVSNK